LALSLRGGSEAPGRMMGTPGRKPAGRLRATQSVQPRHRRTRS
jgi:hypothetical protein